MTCTISDDSVVCDIKQRGLVRGNHRVNHRVTHRVTVHTLAGKVKSLAQMQRLEFIQSVSLGNGKKRARYPFVGGLCYNHGLLFGQVVTRHHVHVRLPGRPVNAINRDIETQEIRIFTTWEDGTNGIGHPPCCIVQDNQFNLHATSAQ